MSLIKAKMSYNAQLLRIKLELSKRMCDQHEKPPADLVQKAKAKMEQIKSAGDVAFYYIYETRLNHMWQALRSDSSESLDRVVTFTLGAGAPHLPGLTGGRAENAADTVYLMLSQSSAIKGWRFEWFKVACQKTLRELGIKNFVNPAQIYAYFTRLQRGELDQVKFFLTELGANANNGKPFSLMYLKDRGELIAEIYDRSVIMNAAERKSFLNQVNEEVRRTNHEQDSAKLVIQKSNVLTQLEHAYAGPESLNLDLPLVMLLALSNQPKATIAQPPENYPGKGKLQVDVSADKMQVMVKDFDMSLYEDKSFKVSSNWITSELARHKILTRLSAEHKKLLDEAINSKNDLNGIVVAEGVAAQAGSGPYLHLIYQDPDQKRIEAAGDEKFDIREHQQSKFVHAGQAVAEIRYRDPGVEGKNVFGEVIKNACDETLSVVIGDGIEARDDSCRFFAMFDGVPTVEGNKISLSRMLVHEGDVNLRTGNIRFDGPVTVTGSIDGGAQVFVTGDLMVEGSIRGGSVHVGGDLQVVGGVTTGEHGKVVVGRNFKADFVENSHVVCQGNITVDKAILNCEVIAGGEVKTTSSSGIIAGGSICCMQNLVTQNLGFKNGAKTTVAVGVSWKAAHAVTIRKARLARLQHSHHEDKQAFRELAHRNANQLTNRHIEMKERLQGRLVRTKKLLTKAEEHLQMAESRFHYNESSKVLCSGTLAGNIQLQVGGQAILLKADLTAVMVFNNKETGNHIQPLSGAAVKRAS